jgi:glycosyltransferase involved in cell wall biosynthesis
MNDNVGPLKVAVLTPPLSKSGGVGTLFTYALPHFPNWTQVRFIDTRGRSKNPWLSLFTLMSAAIKLGSMKLSGSVDIVHLNLGTQGAAVRKITLGLWCKYVLHIPYVMQVHAGSFAQYVQSKPSFIRHVIIHVMNRSQRILALGETWRDLLIDIGCDPTKVEVCVLGVPDLQAQKITNSQAQSIEVTDSHYYLLFAGDMGEWKGLNFLIESLVLTQHKNVRLIVAGRGDIQEWRSLAKTQNVEEKVVFLGLIKPELIHTLLSVVDALILPSKSEGLPVCVLEAYSAGATVISTVTGSLGDFVTDGKDFVEIANRDPQTIAQSIDRAIQLTDILDLQATSHKLWDAEFNNQKQTLKLCEIWKSSFESFQPARRLTTDNHESQI